MTMSIPIQSGRIIDADVKDARQLIFYLDRRPLLAVLDGDVVLGSSCFDVDAAAGTLTLAARPAFGVRYLVSEH